MPQIRLKNERKAKEKAEEQARERRLLKNMNQAPQRRGGAGDPYRDAFQDYVCFVKAALNKSLPGNLVTMDVFFALNFEDYGSLYARGCVATMRVSRLSLGDPKRSR